MLDELHSREVIDFISKNKDEQPHLLALKVNKYPHLPIKYIAHQIHCYQKAKTKLPDFATNEDIIYPLGVSLEQSSSQITALHKSQLIQGKSLTDLTGGFGIDSYYFSKVFERVDYVEQMEELLPVVAHNFKTLGVNNIHLHHGQAESYLENVAAESDCYFLDPARRDEQAQKVFKIADCTPDLNKVLPLVLKQDKVVLVKMSPMLDIQQALNELEHVSEVHVVAVKNECKELLFIIKAGFLGSPMIKAINLTSSSSDYALSFDYDSEQTLPIFSEPLDYIYEPNAAIMKAGGFNTIALQYNLNKLHRNTHLYTSNKHIADFPGRVFKLLGITTLSKKKLKPWVPNTKANITVRNYPESVKTIRKKTGLKDGGDVYIFATTLFDNSPKALICEKAQIDI